MHSIDRFRFPSGARYAELDPPVCLERGVNYNIRLYLGDKRGGYPDERARILIDSLLLVPQTDDLAVFKGSRDAEYRKQLHDR